MTSGNGSGFAVGLFCGAAVGAALGVLFAPKSGAATRRDLARSADGLRLQGMDLYDTAADAATTVSSAVSDLADRGADLVNSVTDAAKTTAQRAKSAHS